MELLNALEAKGYGTHQEFKKQMSPLVLAYWAAGKSPDDLINAVLRKTALECGRNLDISGMKSVSCCDVLLGGVKSDMSLVLNSSFENVLREKYAGLFKGSFKFENLRSTILGQYEDFLKKRFRWGGQRIAKAIEEANSPLDSALEQVKNMLPVVPEA